MRFQDKHSIDNHFCLDTLYTVNQFQIKHSTLQKERLSLSFVSSIVSHSGYIIDEPKIDVGSVDATIRAKGFEDREIRDPWVAIQLKSTTNCEIIKNNIRYDLKTSNYKDLIATNIGNIRLLLLVVFPKAFQDSLVMKMDECILRKCCYWKSLYGLPNTSNTSKVRVTIPLENVFNKKSLDNIFEIASKGLNGGDL